MLDCPLDFVMNHWNFFKDVIIPLIAAFVGAIIGGLFALKAGRKAHENNLEHAKIQKRIRIDGILIAIACELTTLGEKYLEEAGGVLARIPDGQPCDILFCLRQEYFIVYPRNTDIVGQIEDNELVKSIVKTYNTANFLLEMYWINNSLFEQRQATSNIAITGRLDAARVAQAYKLKSTHIDLLGQTENLLRLIKAYREKHPVQ
jgi:hypothetical protein